MNLGVVKGGVFPLVELATYWHPNIHCQFYHCKMLSSRDKKFCSCLLLLANIFIIFGFEKVHWTSYVV
jgi:hypothetical protein